MATTFGVRGTKQCEGGVEIQLTLNGQPHGEGRVYESVAAALAQIDAKPLDLDDLLWLFLRCARARGLTAAQMRARTLTIDLTAADGNVVRFA